MTGPEDRGGLLARTALRFSDWCERWFPDAFVFALLATFVVFLLGLGIGTSPLVLVESWGKGFWDLIPFTLQMSLIIITGYVLATSPPIGRLVARARLRELSSSSPSFRW